jgi:zinc finger CCHC domain-containing protein 9
MTRVTAFGMPKKGPVGSTWEELTGKAESSDMGAKRAADESGSKDSDGDKKRKRPQADSAEGGASSGGWGRNEDVRRKSMYNLDFALQDNRLSITFLRSGKADKSEQRRVGRIENKNASTVCFACRQKGHAARECPNVLLAAQTPDAPVGKGEAQVQKGMKRGKGKMGSDVAGSGGRCYR